MTKRENRTLRDPLPEEIESPEFKAVWECIKAWDIATGLDKNDLGEDLYSHATGSHVVAILDALMEKIDALGPKCQKPSAE